MYLDSSTHIPLRARDGTVRAYAIIDEADAEFVNRWKWSLGSNGYAARGVWVAGRHRKVLLHRALLGLVQGDGLEGDHTNRDRLDNRRSNLRRCTRRENGQNLTSYPGSSSPFRGVHWDKPTRKWRAQIMLGGKLACLGRFRDELDAAQAAQEARSRLMPFAIETPALTS